MRNKLLAMLLALCMVMTMLPVMAFATDTCTCSWAKKEDETKTETDADGKETTTTIPGWAEGSCDSTCNGTNCPAATKGGCKNDCKVCNPQTPTACGNCECDPKCTDCTTTCSCETGKGCSGSGCKYAGSGSKTEVCATCGCDLKCNAGCATKCECTADNKCGTGCNPKPGGTGPEGPEGPSTGGGSTADYDENNHCLCDDTTCASPSHRGPALGSIQSESGGTKEYGAVCVNEPEVGGLCKACQESAAAKANGGQTDDKKDDDKKDDEQKPSTPTAPAVDPNAPQRAEDFIDVQPGEWYNDDLTTLLQKGWFVGQTGGFAPRSATTGAEVVVILSRVLGQDLVTTGSGWNVAATEWAAETGLTEGISITTTDGLARQDLILMLWRAADKPDSSYALTFTDIGGVSGDALAALRWAVEKGIVNGNGDGTVSPNGATKRCEMAALMVRYDKAVNG